MAELRRLLDRGATRPDDATSLYVTAQDGHSEACALLQEHGADLAADLLDCRRGQAV